MPLALVQTVAPAEEPVTLATAKAYLRLDAPDDDATVTALVAASRAAAESYTGRQFVTATWRLSLDQFPYYEGWGGRGLAFTAGLPGYSPFAAYAGYGAIRLPRPALLAVVSVQYVSPLDGSLLTLDPALYRVDSDGEPARVTPAYGQIWPTARAVTNAARVTYQSGYGAAAAVPLPITQAILLTAGHLYEHRGDDAAELPPAARWLLDPYRCLWEF